MLVPPLKVGGRSDWGYICEWCICAMRR